MHMDMHSICTCICIGCLHVNAHADARACAKVKIYKRYRCVKVLAKVWIYVHFYVQIFGICHS